MTGKKTYLFGPVPSRRLGLSLGVDIIPFKVCSLDCMYCQIGRTTEKTIERKDYVPVEEVLNELKGRLADGVRADFITISGSGEPTLNISLGKVVEGIKAITDIPVAILTNGTLFTEKSVRQDCAKADVVLPSLDAADAETFERINRPYADINIENVISGLCTFREEFGGEIWLEVFVIEGVNIEPEQIGAIKSAIERIRPDKVQLNTAVRPTADSGIQRIKKENLLQIAEQLGHDCEVVADFADDRLGDDMKIEAKDLLSMLKRRPCTLDDICVGLGVHRNEALKYIAHLQEQGVISSEYRGETVFFKAN